MYFFWRGEKCAVVGCVPRSVIPPPPSGVERNLELASACVCGTQTPLTHVVCLRHTDSRGGASTPTLRLSPCAGLIAPGGACHASGMTLRP